jgi:DNA-binding CsgD family transcriptional regulator
MKQPVKRPRLNVNGIDSRSIGRAIDRDEGGGCPPMAVKNRSSRTRPVTPRITAGEERVLRWVARGKTNKEIAAVLGISPATVKRHVEKILTKLGLRNRVEIALFGFTLNGCPHRTSAGCALRQPETLRGRKLHP